MIITILTNLRIDQSATYDSIIDLLKYLGANKNHITQPFISNFINYIGPDRIIELIDYYEVTDDLINWKECFVRSVWQNSLEFYEYMYEKGYLPNSKIIKDCIISARCEKVIDFLL